MALGLTESLGALAQDSTPEAASGGESLFTEVGLPEITVTVTDNGYKVSPAEVPAGRYLIALENEGANPQVFASFVQLLEGKSIDDLTAADEIASGTPIPEEGFSPETYAWLYETYIAGGPTTVTDVTRHAVPSLPTGEYGVWAEDPMSETPAGQLTVTGDPEAEITGPEPEAAVSIVEEGAGGVGYEFTLTGELQVGPQIVEVLNASDQPHFVDASQYPEEITVEQVMSAAMFDPSSGVTPSPDMPDFERFTYAGWAGVQSSGTTQWVVMDFAPGQTMLACFIPDPLAGGTPHAFEGML